MFTNKDAGVMLEPQLGMSMESQLSAARLAEDLGFGYLFRSDHLLPTDDRRGIESPECWTSLGAIAASTSVLKFGPMVTPIGFRNPALLAKMASTLHSYSGGRLQLALGSGWYEAEYKAHGYPFPDFNKRRDQFNEAIDIIYALLQKGRADYEGRYFSAHTDCLPRPAGDVHMIIGAKSQSLVRIAAKRADEWNIFVAPEKDYQILKGAFDGALDGRRVEISETGPFMIARTQGDLEKSAEMQKRKLGSDFSAGEILQRIRGWNAICGTVDEFVEQLRAKIDGGVVKYYFQTLVPENREMLELLVDTLKAGV